MLLTSIDMKLDASPTARSHCFVRDHMALNKIKLFPAKRFGILHCQRVVTARGSEIP